jgi:cytochrome c oxidase subunit 4
LKVLTTIIVWAYLVAATVAEVIVFYRVPAGDLVYESIGVLAVTKAVLIAMYFMHLKYEPRPLHYLILIPVILIFVLIMALVFSFGSPPA